MPHPNFVFILRPLKFALNLPYALSPDVEIRRASSEEIARIAMLVNPYFEVNFGRRNPYIYDLVETPAAHGSTFQPVLLLEKDWRYNVVAHSNQSEHYRIQLCGNLVKPTLDLGIHGGGGGVGCEGAKLGAFFDDPERFFESAKTFSEPDAVLLGDIVEHVRKLPDDSAILKAIMAFDNTRIIPRQSEQLAMAYFAIAESLITHQPRLEDTIDSISRQIRTKMRLLSKRFNPRLDYLHFFGGKNIRDIEDLWKKLYSYRSSIAHGGTVDLSKKEFLGLEEPGRIRQYVGEAVRLLIIQWLREPEFMEDLRHC